ncbi:unnamed protein product [Brassica oleracea]|uniref:(rape) hypothetical protein n=1 Tax=Brassica napus TaxID=3708 RepID=A0A816LCZ5_BRANA|nr:unnamed protein product [Brassica napus]
MSYISCILVALQDVRREVSKHAKVLNKLTTTTNAQRVEEMSLKC